jgi:hypothetical protein
MSSEKKIGRTCWKVMTPGSKRVGKGVKSLTELASGIGAMKSREANKTKRGRPTEARLNAVRDRGCCADYGASPSKLEQ